MMSTIGQLFKIEYGQKEYHNKEWLEGTGGKNILISSKGNDNGVYGFFDIQDKFKAPIITVQGYGTIGQAFVQEYDCSVDDHLLILTPKKPLSIIELFQVAFQIRQTKWKYRYGRGITPERLAQEPVKLESLNIDYKQFVQSRLPKPKQKQYTKPMKRLKWLLLTELCDVDRKYAPYINQIDLSQEKTPYITTTETDNGMSVFCNEEPNFKKGSLTVSLDGSCGTSFYQLYNFISGEKTAVLTLKEKNKKATLLIYIGALIRHHAWKFHYGRKLSIARLKKIKLPLPSNVNGDIDYGYIDKIVKNSYGFKEVMA